MSDYFRYFRELVEKYPEILRPRDELCFDRTSDPQAVKQVWRDSGVFMLRNVLPPDVLANCRETFEQFIQTKVKTGRDKRSPDGDGVLSGDDKPAPQWDDGEILYGSWHAPWIIRHAGHAPVAIVLSELVASWAWPVIEAICDSKEISVMFGLCIGRHNIDQDLSVGIHQDATAVNPDLPLWIWIPLHGVKPRLQSGLGFIVPSPGHVIPAKPNNDIGGDYAEENVNNIWVPHYDAGDLTVHSRFSPHFTTGYGTLTDRYSLEIRLWARDDAFTKYGDPSLMISRLGGVPVVSEVRCSTGVRAHGFVTSAAHLVMERIRTPEGSSRPQLQLQLRHKPREGLAGLLDTVKRKLSA
jgi:hypothetical protein